MHQFRYFYSEIYNSGTSEIIRFAVGIRLLAESIIVVTELNDSLIDYLYVIINILL